MNKTTRFDAVDYLQDEQDIAIYLEEAAKQAHAENDTGILLDAISVAAKARGMMQTAKDAGLSRESLYKAGRSQHFLPRDGKPSEVRGGERKNTLLPFAELSVSRFV